MCGLNDDQTLWITFYNISILVYSTCIAAKRFKGLQTGNKAPPPRLYTHLPPRIFVFIVADTPGISEQRAGEGRRLPTLGILNQNDVAVGLGPADRAVAIDNHVMGAFSRRLVWSRTFWRGQKCESEIQDRTVMMNDGIQCGSYM